MEKAGLLPLRFVEESGTLLLVDQRKLPFKEEWFDATAFDDLLFSIKEMVVRGAPSIGVVAGYGHALNIARRMRQGASLSVIEADLESLLATRPTAVNLQYGARQVHKAFMQALPEHSNSNTNANADPAEAALKEAHRLYQEVLDANYQLSSHGLSVISKGSSILTHCNAGPLAACGYGTALGVIRAAHYAGLQPQVFADETRPRNQGRLTAFELQREEIPVTLVCESMSGFLMKCGKIDLVITGADRIALNGDTANKIGTYNLAVLASFHKIPFFIAAPLSTFDRVTTDGDSIPIEFRSEEEVLTFDGARHAPPGVKAINPSFDVTPSQLISGIITEKGILRAPFQESIAAALST